MADYSQSFEIIGPKKKKAGTAFVDTGATFSVIPEPVAEDLGLEPYREQTVDTNNGPVEWPVARAKISVGGKPAKDQDVFISTGDNPLAIGAKSLKENGFQLVARMAREAKSKMDICRGCENMVPHPYLGPTCGDLGVHTATTCGCLLEAKTRMPGQHCPIKKW